MDLNLNISLTSDVVRLLAQDQVWHYRVVPKLKTGNILVVYCEEEANQATLAAELSVILGVEIKLEALPAAQIARLLGTYYRTETHSDKTSAFMGVKGSDDFLVAMISEARGLKSSDIHIEVYEQLCRIRIRIDGMMVERYRLKKEDYPAMINKIKISANLDIAEKRLPQDGRINYRHKELQFDIRVSVLPTLYGEKVVLRLLNNNAVNIDLDSLGFAEFDLNNYLDGIRRPNGIVLISGPTGSGKTTTLYATLKLLNKETRNILTIEDPIEYTLEGVNQVQLKESIGLGFAAALRTFLRQDPDVIMVGEIRDAETANMAIRAALTGHLVLSTIHTNSAWQTVARLIDMSIPPFLLANTLNTTVAQRLVRLLCSYCKKKEPFATSLYPKSFQAPRQITHHFTAVGCDRCHYTGYSGRKAVYEVIPMDHELSAEIRKGNLQVQELLSYRGIATLSENAFALFQAELTSIEEIYPLLYNY